MEEHVAERVGQPGEEPDTALLYRILNRIQSDLEDLASDTGFGNPQEDMK